MGSEHGHWKNTSELETIKIIDKISPFVIAWIQAQEIHLLTVIWEHTWLLENLEVLLKEAVYLAHPLKKKNIYMSMQVSQYIPPSSPHSLSTVRSPRLHLYSAPQVVSSAPLHVHCRV